jgi:hypothetical protein
MTWGEKLLVLLFQLAWGYLTFQLDGLFQTYWESLLASFVAGLLTIAIFGFVGFVGCLLSDWWRLAFFPIRVGYAEFVK